MIATARRDETSTDRHRVEFVMGMAVSIDIRDPDVPGSALDGVVRWLHHVDRTYSPYLDDSVISALGRGELTLEAVDQDMHDVLRRCEELRVASDGIFDVFRIPAPNGTWLDPSGYVKGWAIERAAQMLDRAGCSNFCINAGGDIAARGNPRPGQPWLIGIRHPDRPDAVAAVVHATGRFAVATSATYERGAHIIDPRTGQPVTTLASATVVGPDLSAADAYATILFVMGIDGLGWIAEQPHYDAYVIDHDGETSWTTGFDRYRRDRTASVRLESALLRSCRAKSSLRKSMVNAR